MAGNYPDYPSNRFALDLDGTVFAKADASNNITTFDSTAASAVCNEADDGPDFVNANTWGRFIAVFPELRDINGIFVQTRYVSENSGASWQTPAVEWSSNTTNGIDGTWSTVSGVAVRHQNGLAAYPVSPAYRNAISTVTLTGVRGLRLSASAPIYAGVMMQAFHVFGRIAAGENPNRLEIWHPTLDQRISAAALDWGNVQRASSANLTFRVKNRSATLSANGVTLSLDSLTDASPSFLSAHQVSADGTNFASTASVGTLAPGAISGVMTLRRTVPSNAVLGIWAARLKAVAASWT